MMPFDPWYVFFFFLLVMVTILFFMKEKVDGIHSVAFALFLSISFFFFVMIVVRL